MEEVEISEVGVGKGKTTGIWEVDAMPVGKAGIGTGVGIGVGDGIGLVVATTGNDVEVGVEVDATIENGKETVTEEHPTEKQARRIWLPATRFDVPNPIVLALMFPEAEL